MDNYDKEERIAIIADGCKIGQKEAEREYDRQIEAKKPKQLTMFAKEGGKWDTEK